MFEGVQSVAVDGEEPVSKEVHGEEPVSKEVHPLCEPSCDDIGIPHPSSSYPFEGEKGSNRRGNNVMFHCSSKIGSLFIQEDLRFDDNNRSSINSNFKDIDTHRETHTEREKDDYSYNENIQPKPKSKSSNFIVNIDEMLPIICFLNGWLEIIKSHDSTYNKTDPIDALKSIFNLAPYRQYFPVDSLDDIQEFLLDLYECFNGNQKRAGHGPWPYGGSYTREEGLPHRHIRRDDYYERMWCIKRPGLPQWQLAWSYFSRARLLKLNVDEYPQDYLHLSGPRVEKGAVVYLKIADDIDPSFAMDKWFDHRAQTYRIVDDQNITPDGTLLKLEEWPILPRDDLAMEEGDGGVNGEGQGEGEGHPTYKPEVILRPREMVTLIERNKGKAGALNVYIEFLRLRANKWAAKNHISHPVQTLAAIVDARHMLAEPDVFWNEALPHFASTVKEKGGDSDGKQSVLLVQYPQFFSNVTRDDYLDNRNSGYYTLWQTLRDCARVCTSSGTNAIWDVTDPAFVFATTSRIEDTGTTQQYFDRYLTVHLPCFVAYGIAKETVDYIEAVYRWSAGAVELFWATLFSRQFSDLFFVFILISILAFASFSPSPYAYMSWLALCAFFGCLYGSDVLSGSVPLRRLNVSTVLAMNSMYWISNLSSLVWIVLVPVVICVSGQKIFAHTKAQALTWVWISLLLRLPTVFLTDYLILLAKHLLPKTVEDKWSYNNVLWRSSQLYACSFAYTFLSIISGSMAAFNSKFYNGDNTSWSSFRSSASDISTARTLMRNESSVFTQKYFHAFKAYILLHIEKLECSFGMPDYVTTYLAVGLFLLQIVCLSISIFVVNGQSPTIILVSFLVCGLNMALVADIAILLFPALGEAVGRPVRLEYLMGIVALALVLSQVSVPGSMPNTRYYEGVFDGHVYSPH